MRLTHASLFVRRPLLARQAPEQVRHHRYPRRTLKPEHAAFIVPLSARAESPRLRRDWGVRRKEPIDRWECFSFANAEYRVGAPDRAKHCPDLAVVRGDQVDGKATQ